MFIRAALKKARNLVRRLIYSNRISARLIAPFRRVPGSEQDTYKAWLDKFSPSSARLAEMREQSLRMNYRPVISVVVPVYNPPPSSIAQAIESVLAQTYPYWELCIADDLSTNPEVRPTLERYAAKDNRIKVVFRSENGHISKASNSALEIATGEFVALLDHDDVLTPDALFEVATRLNADPAIESLYTNEDKLDFNGVRCQPTFKPKWSPDYFMSFMYSAHLAVHRKALIDAVGGFRAGYEGAQDYDLALRITERTNRIEHIPKIIYNWRMHPDSVAVNIQAKPYAFDSANKALNDALVRRGEVNCKAERTAILGISRIKAGNVEPKRASIFAFGAFSGDAAKVLQECQAFGAGTLARSNGSESRIELWKRSIASCSSDVVLLIDENIVATKAGWIDELLSQAHRLGIAAVGPKIVSDENGTHLGAGYSVLGDKVTANFYGNGPDSFGYAARLVSMHNVSVLSASCLAVKREALISALNGMTSNGGAHTEMVELSLGLGEKGRLLWDPFAQVTGDHQGFAQQIDTPNHGKIREFKDQFYPVGLDRRWGNFEIDIHAST